MIFKWISLVISIVVFVHVIELGVKRKHLDSNKEEENKKEKDKKRTDQVRYCIYTMINIFVWFFIKY